MMEEIDWLGRAILYLQNSTVAGKCYALRIEFHNYVFNPLFILDLFLELKPHTLYMFHSKKCEGSHRTNC